MALAHIGDSRAYLYRNGVLHQLSHDDTFVQSLVDDGRITEDEAAHHPQRQPAAPGPERFTRADDHRQGDLRGRPFLICSDGLSSCGVGRGDRRHAGRARSDQVADKLIELALIGGGPDNVTVIVADVLEVGPEPAHRRPAPDPDDPEATGPILPIHMTQEMPRVRCRCSRSRSRPVARPPPRTTTRTTRPSTRRHRMRPGGGAVSWLGPPSWCSGRRRHRVAAVGPHPVLRRGRQRPGGRLPRRRRVDPGDQAVVGPGELVHRERDRAPRSGSTIWSSQPAIRWPPASPRRAWTTPAR